MSTMKQFSLRLLVLAVTTSPVMVGNNAPNGTEFGSIFDS